VWLDRIGALAVHALLVKFGVMLGMTGWRFAVHALLMQARLMMTLVT
jgi:hypothetical protein